MIIQNNIMALNAFRQLNTNNSALAKNLEKLSSGYKINRAGDDAAGLAISEKLVAQLLGINQASRNSQNGISLLQTAEGGLQSIQDNLQRMRELAVQSASGTNQKLDRAAMNTEANELAKEIDQTAETTEFNQMQLLNGSLDPAYTSAQGEQGAALSIQAGANEGQTVDISIGAMNAQSLGVDNVDLSEAGTAQSAIANIDNALNAVSLQRAEIGAMQNRLEFRMQNLEIQAENAASANSRIRDTDIAREMIDKTRNNILSQAAMAMKAQANSMPNNVLPLIR